ncbi:low-density lipoprotein receptor class A domain-containing protein 3-like isoform X2 [Macrosteles quadrilineatus]|uniref:low-density lipoprotein receptor class A domain-containing protein 3-like isoform X2 n=1 Tax=Macrosteles quadrilineatus TaxID=74068 RepID=UPI0023E1F462|nr:low-density lipoprotein receptor class A domain-containing protein 3-like isoform X2 [Macrosteles quadrilineatus]
MTIFVLFFLIWPSICSSTVTAEERKDMKDVPFIVIEPLFSREFGPSVVKQVQDTLNLTCTVFYSPLNLEPRYNITWTTPISLSNSKNHVVIQAASSNSVNLVVPHLESRDEGIYACSAQPFDSLEPNETLFTTVRVNIKNRKCANTMFACSSSKHQGCIPQRYKCDGYQDCQKGEDEDQILCGVSPCSDKVQCEDPLTSIVRCIPKTWCCNIRVDPNCTREPLSCCPPIFFKPYVDERNYFGNQPHMTDMTFIQTTIYTVIGCVLVFMIVMTVLVIAICRVHMKRSLMSQCPTNPSQTSQLSQNTPMYDLDVYLNRGCVVDRDLAPPGFLVTYNINNGVQIVGHTIDPPPYCEVICSPPKEGPPPPYSSRETLNRSLPETEALLQQPSTSMPSHSALQGENESREGMPNSNQ